MRRAALLATSIDQAHIEQTNHRNKIFLYLISVIIESNICNRQASLWWCLNEYKIVVIYHYKLELLCNCRSWHDNSETLVIETVLNLSFKISCNYLVTEQNILPPVLVHV